MLKEYIHYTSEIKRLLHFRDQKQIDHEQLALLLASTEKDLARMVNERRIASGAATTLVNPDGSTLSGMMVSGGMNPVKYVRDKVQEARGVDREKLKEEQIRTMQTHIQEVRGYFV